MKSENSTWFGTPLNRHQTTGENVPSMSSSPKGHGPAHDSLVQISITEPGWVDRAMTGIALWIWDPDPPRIFEGMGR